MGASCDTARRSCCGVDGGSSPEDPSTTRAAAQRQQQQQLEKERRSTVHYMILSHWLSDSSTLNLAPWLFQYAVSSSQATHLLLLSFWPFLTHAPFHSISCCLAISISRSLPHCLTRFLTLDQCLTLPVFLLIFSPTSSHSCGCPGFVVSLLWCPGSVVSLLWVSWLRCLTLVGALAR